MLSFLTLFEIEKLTIDFWVFVLSISVIFLSSSVLWITYHQKEKNNLSLMIPDKKTLPGSGWSKIKEEKIGIKEILKEGYSESDLNNWEFKRGTLSLFKSDKLKAYFLTLIFKSEKGAKKFQKKIEKELKNKEKYQTQFGSEIEEIYDNKAGIDLSILRKRKLVLLCALGGHKKVKKGDSKRLINYIKTKSY